MQTFLNVSQKTGGPCKGPGKATTPFQMSPRDRDLSCHITQRKDPVQNTELVEGPGKGTFTMILGRPLPLPRPSWRAMILPLICHKARTQCRPSQRYWEGPCPFPVPDLPKSKDLSCYIIQRKDSVQSTYHYEVHRNERGLCEGCAKIPTLLRLL